MNYYNLLPLELFCQRSGKWDEIPYVQAFMMLHNGESKEKKAKLMVQKKGKVTIPLSDSKDPREEAAAANWLNVSNPPRGQLGNRGMGESGSPL